MIKKVIEYRSSSVKLNTPSAPQYYFRGLSMAAFQGICQVPIYLT